MCLKSVLYQQTVVKRAMKLGLFVHARAAPRVVQDYGGAWPFLMRP